MGAQQIPTSQVPKPSGAVNATNAIAYASEIATGIATTIAGVRDDRMRNNFQQNLQLLTNDQKIALAKALNNANNQEERLKLLGLALTDMSKQRINNIQLIVAEQEKNRRNKLITTALQVSALFVVGGFLVYYLAKK